MSRKRVADGTDERGRPRMRWADPEAIDEPRFSHMEPAHVATIERRRATPLELEAAKAREGKRDFLPRPAVQISDSQMTAASRRRGAERHVQVMRDRDALVDRIATEVAITASTEAEVEEAVADATRAAEILYPLEEEPPVDEPATDHAETIPLADPDEEPAPIEPVDPFEDPPKAFNDLVVAAAAARDAWIYRKEALRAFDDADAAWGACRRALAEAIAAAAPSVELEVVPWSALPSFEDVRAALEAAMAGPYSTGSEEPVIVDLGEPVDDPQTASELLVDLLAAHETSIDDLLIARQAPDDLLEEEDQADAGPAQPGTAEAAVDEPASAEPPEGWDAALARGRWSPQDDSQAAGGGSGDPDLSRLTSFQSKVLEATIRHRGDRKAVAAEIGAKFYQSVDNQLEKIGAKGLLPADLIPLLPSRFAKYLGV